MQSAMHSSSSLHASEPQLNAGSATPSSCSALSISSRRNAAHRPSLVGLIGKKEEVADGRTIVIEREYSFESITHPNARKVRGFPPVMPEGYRLYLKPEQVAALVTYLESL